MKNFKLDIFGTVYEVKFVDKFTDELLQEHGVTSGNDLMWFGLTDGGCKEILVATKNSNGKDITPNEIKCTLLHELMHAIFNEGGYGELGTENIIEWIAKCLRSLLNQKAFMESVKSV